MKRQFLCFLISIVLLSVFQGCGTEESIEEMADGFELFQNSPNPFNEQTVISFILPEAQIGFLSISNFYGREILSVEGDFSEGYNEITINREDLENAAGNMIYKFKTDTHSETKNMLRIE